MIVECPNCGADVLARGSLPGSVQPLRHRLVSLCPKCPPQSVLTLVPYVGAKLRSESDYLDARCAIKAIAEHAPNHIDAEAGEDLRHPDTPKQGVAPLEREDQWDSVGDLLPYVEMFLLPADARTPIRFTYEVRHQPGRGRRRILHIGLDLLSPTTSPVTPDAVLAQKQQFFNQVSPLVTGWFPLHEHVEAALSVGEPVARHMQGAGGVSGGVHLRTPILMSFGVPWQGLVDLESTNARPRQRMALLDKHGRPIR